MVLDALDRALVAAVQDGLAFEPRPFAAVGRRLGISEAAVIERLQALLDAGHVKRFGVVVRHHELGYRANAMVVWDIPDAQADAAGERLSAFDCVTLCYRRPRRPPAWPYNLFTMVHGRDRGAVLERIEAVAAGAGLAHVPRAVLFSTRRFKQRGARYASPQARLPEAANG